LLLFDATKRFFGAWIAQLANYGLITVLTVMVAALLLRVVQSYATQTAARGTALLTVDALNMVLIAVLVFLVLRQVMPIASGLAGGASLNSFGFVSRTGRGIGWGVWHGGKAAIPASRYVAGRLRRTADTVLGTPVRSSLVVNGKAVSDVEALGRGWRDMNR
jgi:type IV secretion system protein VirB6